MVDTGTLDPRWRERPGIGDAPQLFSTVSAGPVVGEPSSSIAADGIMRMTQQAAIMRLAVAVFDDGDSLCRAVRLLFSAGFVSEQIGLLGRAATFERFLSDANRLATTTAEVLGIFAQIERLAQTDGRGGLFVSRGSIWQRLRPFGLEKPDGVHMPDWMSAELRADLTDYIDNGAVAVALNSASFDQQRKGTRVLLEHSSHRVQTHDFRM